MRISRVEEARLVAQSASAKYIILIKDNKLHVSGLGPGRGGIIETGIPLKNILSAAFSEDEAHIVLLSRQRVEVINRANRAKVSVLDNGSGALGCYYSADFVSNEHLLTIWEFGRARVWSIETGRFLDLGDFKMWVDGPDDRSWALRPTVNNTLAATLIHLATDGADDMLHIRTPAGKLINSLRLRTADAQDVSFSPDGRWFAVRDSPAYPEHGSIHVYTPDGNQYFSYSRNPHQWINSLGVKSLHWSPACDLVAVSNHYGDLVLLDTKMFLPKEVLEHTAVIRWASQGIRISDVKPNEPLWREMASASNERSYERIRQPVHTEITRLKPSTDPHELGVAEARFNCTGDSIATRDERYQSTIWIWNLRHVRRDAMHAVLIQYRNVRKMQWHPTLPQCLMFDCGEDIVYHYDISKPQQPPQIMNVAPALRGTATYSWVTSTDSDIVIRAATKRKYCLVYPDGLANEADEEMLRAQPVHMGMLAERRDEERLAGERPDEGQRDEERRDEASDRDDSLNEILTGRKPLPAKGQEDSYTELVDPDGDSTMAMEDTFREKKPKPTVEEVEMDPLDDSQIF
ncbi:hypothetical protein LTR85_000249 [Meristemomyces frigidus]|nr:hypothetical protein LTR85_000249 [Meristemomyces frigidus]